MSIFNVLFLFVVKDPSKWGLCHETFSPLRLVFLKLINIMGFSFLGPRAINWQNLVQTLSVHWTLTTFSQGHKCLILQVHFPNLLRVIYECTGERGEGEIDFMAPFYLLCVIISLVFLADILLLLLCPCHAASIWKSVCYQTRGIKPNDADIWHIYSPISADVNAQRMLKVDLFDRHSKVALSGTAFVSKIYECSSSLSSVCVCVCHWFISTCLSTGFAVFFQANFYSNTLHPLSHDLLTWIHSHQNSW